MIQSSFLFIFIVSQQSLFQCILPQIHYGLVLLSQDGIKLDKQINLIFNQMKYLLYFLSNIAVSIIVFYTMFRNQDYAEASSTVQCLKEEAKDIFCAQCVERIKQQNLHEKKGFTVYSKQAYAILILQSSIQRTCDQYLQIINYQKLDKTMKIPFEFTDNFQLQYEGKLQMNLIGAYIVSPQYKSFIIYRLFGLDQSRKTTVKYPDSTQITTIMHKLVYLLNGIIVLLAILYYANKDIFIQLKIVLILIAVHYIMLQNFLLQHIPHDIGLKIARICIISILLCSLKTSKNILCGAILGFSYAATQNPLNYLIYLNLIAALIFTKGMNQHRFRNVWTYIILNLMVYILNQFFWFFLQQQIADIGCRFIELMFLILTPTGIMFIKEEKQTKLDFGKHKERQSISLSGFEEQQLQEQKQNM